MNQELQKILLVLWILALLFLSSPVTKSGMPF